MRLLKCGNEVNMDNIIFMGCMNILDLLYFEDRLTIGSVVFLVMTELNRVK